MSDDITLTDTNATADVPAQKAGEAGQDDCSARPYPPFAVEFAAGAD